MCETSGFHSMIKVTTVFWDMGLCTFVEKCHHFVGTYEGRSEINASYFIMLAHDVRGEYC